MSEPITWITKNGKHIPIYADKPTEEEQRKNKQIEQNEQSARSLNEKEVTKEDIRKAFISDESYTNDPEYQALHNAVRKAFNERETASKERRELEEQLKTESMRKPKEEWTDEDEFQYLVGQWPKKYTERGKELKAKSDEVWNRYTKADHEWSDLAEQLRVADQRQSDRQKELYTKSSEHDGKVKNASGEYFGFKTAESSTPYIDEKIKQGKAVIVEMPPKMYLQEIAHKIFPRATIETTLRGISVKDVNKYMKMMKEGTKFDTPYLNYRDQQQEGRHRAIAAYMLGVEKIPVIIVKK